MQLPKQLLPVLTAIIAVILVVAALRATQSITVPLAFAFFIAVLVHPLQARLNRRLPRGLSLAIVLLLLAAILGIGIGVLYLSIDIANEQMLQYLEQLDQLWTSIQSWAQSQGLPIEPDAQTQRLVEQVSQQALGGAKSVLSALSLFTLMVSMLVLLLLEVGEYQEKLKQAFPASASRRISDAISNTSGKLRRYLAVMGFTSLLTGISTVLWCWLLGVNLAIVWGLVAFVLNFVPTLGSIIAVIPPTLVGLSQGIGTGIATLLGLMALQFFFGNFVDPKLQGKSLQLSPFVALVSIIFWGWVWGIPGALIGIPMTVFIVLLCQEFAPTQGIAILLSGLPHSKKS
ncbi:AI-2E family transporter [Romeria aff. gracilis LEGE 07310]|uniref:AI-2E family transporter n=1 Tax=Vasconcelosia minhoensis LEGE 07310 TaxID=915328 RepID=A0A8J7DRY7_9CYAN|nr:AI-2E family transporter [Romeria gracilis]MBE9079549.1 AI-2E family transporter [Romeria aff. gracilis LEGE 07310]